MGSTQQPEIGEKDRKTGWGEWEDKPEAEKRESDRGAPSDTDTDTEPNSQNPGMGEGSKNRPLPMERPGGQRSPRKDLHVVRETTLKQQ